MAPEKKCWGATIAKVPKVSEAKADSAQKFRCRRKVQLNPGGDGGAVSAFVELLVRITANIRYVSVLNQCFSIIPCKVPLLHQE